MDKLRIVVEEAVTRKILSRDLPARDVKFVGVLSGPCTISFTLPYQAAQDIKFRAYGQIVHLETLVLGQYRIIGSGIVQPGGVDASGNVAVEARGFSSYAEGIPWLENWNPVTVDPFVIFKRIWTHLQSYSNGNLNVTVTPDSSGTQLLPGFGFDGDNLNLEFFAFFLRKVDFRDCAEEMNKLARDITFDYTETSAWNATRTQIDKSIVLAYPRRGAKLNNIVFRLNENVLEAVPNTETEIDWVSNVIVRSWFPGRVFNGEFNMPDPTRFRRVIMEDDAQINSKERAAVWAKRKLYRKSLPKHWSQITVDPDHPSAPYGSWAMGDDVLVQGLMPGEGRISEWHRIMGYNIDGQNRIVLSLKHTDAFNYDPISF